jgi:hypothetical protein
VSTDFNTEVNELARAMKDVVDTASGKMQFIFDDVSRICITSAIRVIFAFFYFGLLRSRLHLLNFSSRQHFRFYFRLCNPSLVM